MLLKMKHSGIPTSIHLKYLTGDDIINNPIKIWYWGKKLACRIREVKLDYIIHHNCIIITSFVRFNEPIQIIKPKY